MKKSIVCILAMLPLLLANIAFAQVQKLSPTCVPGMHWQASWDNTGRIRTTETPMGTMNSPGFMQEKSKAELRVMEAENGKFKVLEIDFGQCELHVQMAGGARAMNPDHPLAGRKIRVERRFDPDTREEKFDITAQGAAITPEMEDSIRGYFCLSPMPDTPVTIGQRWKSDRVDFVLGPKAKGTMALQFLQIETIPSGRRRAVVQVSGEAAMEYAGGGGLAGQADLSVDYNFSGKIKIDLQSGLVEAIDLTGPMRLNHGAGMGQAIVQRGEWTYRWEAAPLEPVVIAALKAAAPDAPIPAATAMEGNPLDTAAGPDPYAGTYKNDRVVLELKCAAAGYIGSLQFGGKTFPLVAAKKANTIEGAFRSGNNDFPFTAAPEENGTRLKFTSGRSAYLLQKETPANPLDAAPANPLDQAAHVNPLAR